MIVVDTKVLSEPTRRSPDPHVLDWLEEHDQDDIRLAAITVGELLNGVELLPRGRRRDRLAEVVESLLSRFHDSILAYDARAARHYARLRATRRQASRPISAEDGMIAAICLREGAALATRNTTDFELSGLELINPWDDDFQH